MSDSYEINGVSVTAKGGGVYELRHPSLAEPAIERGKEKADQRAADIAKAAAAAEPPGHIAPQGTLEAAPPVLPPKAEAVEDPKDVEIARLKDELAARGESKVEAENPPLARPAAIGAVPRKFEGEMNAETRRLLKAMGLGIKRIILEENETIPPTGLFLGHNGRGYMIAPGIEVDVPEFLLGVLNDAVMAAPIVDNKSQKVLGYRDRLRYPYREVK